MTEPNDDAGALAGLTAKRDELLAENRALKARISGLEGELGIEKARADTAEGAIRALRVDGPIDAFVSGAFPSVPPHIAKALLGDLYSFDLGEAGALRVTDKAGAVVMEAFDETRLLAALRASSLAPLLVRATGGDVPGGANPRHRSALEAEREKPAPTGVAPRFGLR